MSNQEDFSKLMDGVTPLTNNTPTQPIFYDDKGKPITITAEMLQQLGNFQPQPKVESEVKVAVPDIKVVNNIPLNVEKIGESEPTGLLIEDTPKKDLAIGAFTDEGMDKINKKFALMDEEIDEAKANYEKVMSGAGDNVTSVYSADDNDKENAPEEGSAEYELEKLDTLSSDELIDKYKENLVIIEKSAMGGLIHFTEEEKEKLERASTIRLHELEDKDILVGNVKKLPSDSATKRRSKIKSLVKAARAPFTTFVTLCNSGIYVELSAASTYEITELVMGEKYNTSGDPSISINAKYSVIYDHVVSTSIGNLTYDEFCHNVSPLDYNTLIYGILVATYGTQDRTMIYECHNPLEVGPDGKVTKECKTEYEVKFKIKDLIRTERMSSKLVHLFNRIVETAAAPDIAQDWRKQEAPLLQCKVITLPQTGIKVEIQIESVYELIHRDAKVIQSFTDNEEFLRSGLAKLACNIRKCYIPDSEGGDPFVAETREDIVDVLYELPDDDTVIVASYAETIIDAGAIEYGIMNLTCPVCKTIIKYQPVDLETMLFYQVGKATTRKVKR